MTQIVEGKVMWKWRVDEVHALVVALTAQCAEGVQFNWVNYLCSEFLANFTRHRITTRHFITHGFYCR